MARNGSSSQTAYFAGYMPLPARCCQAVASLSSATALRPARDPVRIIARHRRSAMLKVHHLNNSRSQRILWLLEELGAPYEIVQYQRMTPVPLAPPELKKIHPLGKSPVITDGDITIAESGAIVEYILDKFGKGRLRPQMGSKDHVKYIEWMHYAEGSAMLPLMMHLYAG